MEIQCRMGNNNTKHNKYNLEFVLASMNSENMQYHIPKDEHEKAREPGHRARLVGHDGGDLVLAVGALGVGRGRRQSAERPVVTIWAGWATTTVC